MEILEILKYILPSLVVLACSYLMLRQFHQREEKKERLELLIGNSKTVVDLMVNAMTSADPAYTLESVYDRAPKYQ